MKLSEPSVYLQINMTEPLSTLDYSGKLSIGRSCLCFTRWSRPCQAHFLTHETKPVLQIEKRGGKVKQVSLADAAFCPKPMTSCPCFGNEEQKLALKLPGGKRLLLKAASAEGREEWRVRLEAAMLLPLLEEKGISVTSLSAAAVDVVEYKENKEELKESKMSLEKTQGEPHMLPVVSLPEKKVEVENQEKSQDEGGVQPMDVYALSEGHTTWERVKKTPEGSVLASQAAENSKEKKSCNVNIPDEGDEALSESDENTLSKESEWSVVEVPSWMGLIRRGEVLEPDMMTFNYKEMFEEAAQMEENMVPRRSALINSILRQLIQTMNPSKVCVYVVCI